MWCLGFREGIPREEGDWGMMIAGLFGVGILSCAGESRLFLFLLFLVLYPIEHQLSIVRF